MLRASAARARQRGFFDFSFPELAITFGLALVVLGPKKLPGLVAQVGRWVGRARHMARQFREQLEQEVNSINAVKPIPRHVPPEVGPVAPEIQAANATDAHSAATEVRAEGSAASSTAGNVEGGTEGKVDAAANEVHPEAQIYFALNGTEPEVVAENPYAAQNDPYAPHVDDADPARAGEPPAANPPPAPDTQSEASSEPASVKVLFPHDHG